MARVFSALPARALHARPPVAVASLAWGIFAFLMMGLMLVPLPSRSSRRPAAS